LGAAQRGIESEGIAADRSQFEEERDFPYKQVQYLQSLLQGLPLAAQSYQYQQPAALTSLMNTSGGIQNLYKSLFGGNTTATGNEAVVQEPASTVGDDDTYINSPDYIPYINTGTAGGANT